MHNLGDITDLFSDVIGVFREAAHIALRIAPFFVISLLSGVLAVIPGWVRAEGQSSADEVSSIGVAVFNMAWAGTMEDFKRHVEVCSAPGVNWCAARSRTSWGAFHPEAEEEVRSTLCQKQFIAAAGGLDAAMMVAPCTAYGSRKHPALAETIENYDLKLEGLRATVEKLIEAHGIHMIAFQEVKSEEVVRHALGRFSGRFEVCVAPHSTFQTVAFAWDKSVLASEYTCTPHRDLAIAEHMGEKYRRVRPGLALELIVNGLPVTFLNIHLKSGCANLHGSRRWPSHLLTDPEAACTVLNRQVPILEDWIEQVASRSPRFILLGDFNRRIDQEARARIARTEVRADGSDPAEANIKDEAGGVKSDYLWQEIADGSPPMYQVYLKSLEPGCKGLAGLDHIVVSEPIKRAQRERLYSSKIAPVKRSRQPIPTSDHCPTITTVEL